MNAGNCDGALWGTPPGALGAWARRVLAGLLGLACALPAVALPSPPDNTVYGNVGTTLYTITPSTGAAVSVGTLSFATAGIARDPITGRVYYADSSATGLIAYFDPTTGTNTTLPTALGFATNRLGFRADGVMFSMNPSTNNIYVIDRNTGNPTIVATVQGVPLNGGGDMAFTPNDDLYIVTSSTIFRTLMNPILVPPAGAVPPMATTSAATGTTGSPTGLTFINNGVALGTPSTGIVDLGLTGGFTNARGANGYSDLGASPKFADLAISVSPSSSNFPRSGSASYAVAVLNNGPQSGSGNFTVTFTLPTGLTLVGAGPFGSGWACSGGPAVTCTNTTASLVAGASLPGLSVPVTTSVAGGTNSLSTSFSVAGTTFDSVTANNTTTVLTSVGAATISKTFLTNPMAKGGSSTLVFTLSNPTGSAFSGVSFSDTLPTTPGAMVVAATPAASTSGCGTPTFAPAAGAASLAFSGGSIAAGGSCTVHVNITAPTSGSYSNTSSGVVTTETGAGAGAPSNTASVLVMTPPTLVKGFSPSPVIPNGPSTLTLTLSNPAANGSNDLTGVSFTDIFPTAPGPMTLADTTIGNSCGGSLSDAGGAALAAGSTAVKLLGGSVPAGGSCVISVNTKAPTAGTYNNTTGVVSSANAGSGAVSNTASVVVQSVVAPSIAKDFSPTPIAVNGTSTLTFTISNANPTTALTGVAFTDTFPTSPGVMRVAGTPATSTTGCGAPTFAPAAAAVSLTFSGGSIAAGGTCIVKVNITLLAVGAYVNTSGAVSATGPSALTGNTATANIATLAPPVLSKAFSPATIGTGSTSTVTITISNANGSQAMSGVALTDVLPTTPGAMKVAATPNASVSGCGAPTFAPAAAATSVAFSNGSIAGGGLCTIRFDVTAPTAGSYSNSTGSVSTSNGGTGVANTATLTVVATAPVSISKRFLTRPMAANVAATLRFTLSNPNTATALTGVAFSDTLPTSPGAMVVAATPAASTSGCGAATFAPTAGAAVVTFSGGSIPASGVCTVDVNVVAPAAGTYANSTSTVSSSSPATTGAAALDNVDVLAPPSISKTFLSSPVAVNVPTTLRFDISNPNSLALDNLSFTDSLPGSPGTMVVAPVPNASVSAACASPSFAPTAGATALAFSTASIAAGATCRVTVDVVAPVVGSYVNTSSAISSTNGGSGNLASATLNAVALNVPTLSKSFASAGPIAPGTSNTLTLTLGNSNASAITLSTALTDNLPSGMTVASPANSSGSCAGVTATPGASKITLAAGASIPPGGCTVVADVVASTGGSLTNTLAAGALVTSAGSNASAASASFSVPFAPAATKSFSPSTVAVGATAVLKITLANGNASTAISGAAFTDNYPGGLVNTATPAGTISGTGCSGTVIAAANGTALSLSAGVIPAAGSCDISVNVSSASAGNYLNSSGAISTSNVGTGNASSATLTVSVGAPLTVAKSFVSSPVAPGAASVLRIRLSNPNGVAITGAAFTDSYPAGLVNTATPAGTISGAGCTGSVTAAVNGTALALSAGNIPASSFCDITANVTSNSPGSYANSSGTVATSNAGTAAASSATLVVLAPPTVAKRFAPVAVSVGSTSLLTISISNPNSSTALAGVAFTDTYPAGLANTGAPAGAISGAGCSGTVTAAASGTSLSLASGSVPAGGSCDVTVNVSSASAATYNNSSGPVSTSNAGSGAASIGSLSVVSGPAPLTVIKAFTPASIGTNDSTLLKITLQNPNGTAVTGAAFTDSYPFSLFNSAVPGAAISGTGCSGTATAAANGSSLALSGGTVPANSSCDISASVTSAAANTYINSSGTVSTSNAGSSAAVTGTLVVLSHVTVAKSFSPTTVSINTASVLKITLSNPNSVAVTGAAFTDNYPGGLLNTGTPAGAISGAGCSGTVTASANGTALVLSGGTLPAGGSCDISANVSSAGAGSYANNTGAVSTGNAGAGASAAATLTVSAPVTPLLVNKVFAPASIGSNDSTQLKITLTNNNAFAVTGAAFTDNYPGAMVNTGAPAGAISGTGCSGTVTAAANGTALALSGGSVPANASCDVTANVTSASTGSYSNSSGVVSTSNVASSSAASGTLVVLAHVTVAKSFTPTTVSTNAASLLRITISNPNSVAATGVALTDNYPGGLVNTGTPNASISGAGCSGSVTAAANGAALSLTGGSVPAGGSCTISANVSSASAGTYANNSGAISTANAGAGLSAGASLTVSAIEPPPAPQVSKVFTPNSIAINGATVLKITLVNVNNFALTSVAFTDNYPAAMLNTATPSAAISGSAGCSGVVTAAANGTSLSLAAGNLPANGTCDISVNVSATAAGYYVNSSGPVATAEAPNATAANGSLTVLAPLSVQKTFSPSAVQANAPSVLKITLSNPNGVALTAVAFNDAYPSGLLNTATPAGALSGAGCSGSVTAAANGAALVLSGGTVPAGGSCDISANVSSSTVGSYTNNSGPVSSSQAGSSASASATLTVSAALQAPSVTKSFTPAAILTGDISVLRVSISNPNATAITGAAFVDNYPATLSNTGSAAFNSASVLAGCSGTVSGVNGSASLSLSNATLPAGVSCMIDVNVTSNASTPVLLTNPAFTVSTANTPSGSAVAANLQVLVRPTISKSFSPSQVQVAEASTLSLLLSNPNPVPLSALSFTDTFPSGLAVTSTPGALNGCGGSLSAAAAATSISLTGGSLAANQSCTISVAVSSGALGAYSNTSGGVSTFETGAATATSNTAVLTVVAASGAQLAGTVYSDANHNLQRDSGEAGTGLLLYAKLVPTGSPSGPASQAVLVDASSGAYLFSNVAAGDYTIVIDDNSSLADVTATVSASWTGTEHADLTRRNVALAGVDVSNLNFGLFNGNLVSGRVFRDNGAGGGTPNNAVQDGSEAGLAGVALRVSNSAGSVTYDSTTTDAAGNYRLWVPAALTGTTLRVVEDNPPGYRSVGGAPAAGYDRSTDSASFSFSAGSNTPNLNFADVAIETLVAGQQRSAAAGDVVFYAHTFTPGTGGSVLFSSTSSAGWPQTVWRDSNCNGVLDANETVINAAINTSSGVPVCLIVKVVVPAGSAVGLQNLATLQAMFSYSNASPALTVSLVNDDLTTVSGGSGGGASLALVKSQDNPTPLPGGRIVYTLQYSNLGSGSISALRINDSTPAFTKFVSAACLGPLAAGLTACSVTSSPPVGSSGAIEWTLTGSLLPSAAGQVSFSVDIDVGP